jgi:hypothetical protein
LDAIMKNECGGVEDEVQFLPVIEEIQEQEGASRASVSAARKKRLACYGLSREPGKPGT